MGKILYITHCSQCCHQTKHMVLCEDGYEIVDSATCELTGNELEYKYFGPFKLNQNVAFPNDCPLDNAADESSIGDLTPEDIQRINETARRIQNAKNIKDRWYG